VRRPSRQEAASGASIAATIVFGNAIGSADIAQSQSSDGAVRQRVTITGLDAPKRPRGDGKPLAKVPAARHSG
jgi:hypothetical protein